MDFKAVLAEAELKILGPDDPQGATNGLLYGYASRFSNWDRARELIEPGAHAPHLAAFLKEGFAAWNHEWGSPIATPVEAYETPEGLYTVSEFHSTPFAQEKRQIAAERLARGKTMGFSIGYDTLKSAPGTLPDGTPGRRLLDVPVYEYSLVTVPANRLAGADGVKGWLPAGWPLAEHTDGALAVLDDYCLRTQALAALRLKEGRVLSAANRERIAAVHARMGELHTQMGDLLHTTEPAPKTADPALVAAIVAAARAVDASRKELQS